MLGYSDGYADLFKLRFDEGTDMIFSVGSSELYKYGKPDVSLVLI